MVILGCFIRLLSTFVKHHPNRRDGETETQEMEVSCPTSPAGNGSLQQKSSLSSASPQLSC